MGWQFLAVKTRRWVWLLLAAGVVDALLGYWWWDRRRDRNHDGVILAAAQRYAVEPALVKAVVWRESRFNPRAKGKAGEIGLMQIREPAAREWAAAENLASFQHQQLFDPAKNTQAGAWYLAKLLRRYVHADNPTAYALADYNAGRNNVLRWNKGPAATNSAAFLRQMDFPGTRQYIIAVQKRYRYYRTHWKPDPVK
jgi:soluble lytic murein transglycosylase